MPAIAIWIWFCAYLNCAGWALSAVHQLNAGGYAVALLVWLAALFVWRKHSAAPFPPRLRWRQFRRRFRRPFPLAFLILAALAFAGGAGYAPTNYDALAYRVPRVLHWLAANQWQWIHSIFPRLNNRSCGIEWVSAPWIALFKTDRWLFLINLVSFLLLPGLVFSVFTRLGVARRVAWRWMWLLPTGYCFLLQAGSMGNDLFGAPFALAAVDFALRAKVSGRQRDFFASLLAAALLTSAKTSSLPLGLPWAIAILPSFRPALRRPLSLLAVCLLAIFASVLPTLVFNQNYSGNWSGADLNDPGINNVALRTGANAVLLAAQNLAPPVFPLADRWNRGVVNALPPALNGRLHAVIAETQAIDEMLPQMQIEEGAGLGFGVSLLLLAGFLVAGFHRLPSSAPANRHDAWLTLLRWSPAVSLLALMTQYNLAVISRILTPYYALLVPIILAGRAQERLVRTRWWRAAAGGVFVIAGGLLAIQPARPLFPALTLAEHLQARHPDSKPLARIVEVYSVYHSRNDAFAPARAALRPDLEVLGMITFDDPETSLWRPFGARRIVHVCPKDSAAELKARGIEYILVNPTAFGLWFQSPLDDWLGKMNARTDRKISLNLRAATGPSDWLLVKLN